MLGITHWCEHFPVAAAAVLISGAVFPAGMVASSILATARRTCGCGRRWSCHGRGHRRAGARRRFITLSGVAAVGLGGHDNELAIYVDALQSAIICRMRGLICDGVEIGSTSGVNMFWQMILL